MPSESINEQNELHSKLQEHDRKKLGSSSDTPKEATLKTPWVRDIRAGLSYCVLPKLIFVSKP